MLATYLRLEKEIFHEERGPPAPGLGQRITHQLPRNLIVFYKFISPYKITSGFFFLIAGHAMVKLERLTIELDTALLEVTGDVDEKQTTVPGTVPEMDTS